MFFVKIKHFFMWLITPVQKFLQRIGRQEAKITTEAVTAISDVIEDGDILLCYESGRPTSALIKGKYNHAVIYFNGKIYEAVGDKWVYQDGVKVNIGGVREVDLIKWLYQVDGVCLIRADLPKYIREAAGKNAPKYLGIGYDYIFNYGGEKIYCSELPYLCFRTEDSGFMPYIGNNEEILPQVYRDQCGKDFILIYEFEGK